MISLLLSRTGLTIGGIGLAAILAYSWHRSVVRAEQQRVEAETRSVVRAELDAQHKAQVQALELEVLDWQSRFAELAKTKAAATQRIEVAVKEAQQYRETIPTFDDNAVLAEIRRFRAESATAKP